MQIELKPSELALIYNALEECLNLDDWEHLTEPIEGTMNKIDLYL